VQAIGRAALAAVTPSPTRLRLSATVLTGRGRLSSPSLLITAVDTYTGDRCVLSSATGVTMAAAAAASGAVPGLFAPQPIGDRRLMDGGVSGTGVHLDLLAGARRALVLSLSDGTEPGPGMMTNPAGSFLAERAALESTGTEVFARSPEVVELEELMAPSAVPRALDMGARQARADLAELRSFWS
jgi:NTE family protein